MQPVQNGSCDHGILEQFLPVPEALVGGEISSSFFTLLSFLGSGEHTDVTAHLFGMIVGIFLGMMVSHWKKYVQRPDCQLLSMILTAGIVAGSFFQGFWK